MIRTRTSVASDYYRVLEPRHAGPLLRTAIEGIKFPVENGYVYLRAGGGFSSAMAGKGMLTEVGGLVGVGAAARWQFTIWIRPVPGAGSRPAPTQKPAATPWPAMPTMR